MEAANNIELTQFRRWYSQAGTPTLTVDQRYDAEEKRLHLTIRQSCPPTPNQPVKQALHIPIKLGLLENDGSAVSIQLNGQSSEELTLSLTDTEEEFVFENLAAQPIVSLLRGFSAPVMIKMQRRKTAQ